MKKASIILTTILTSIFLSILLIVNDEELLTPKESNKLYNYTNDNLITLIKETSHENIKLQLPLLIIKFKTGEERISSIINIGLSTEEIDLKYIEDITPIKANQIIKKYTSEKISNKHGQNATILKYNQHLFLTHELNGLLPIETNKLNTHGYSEKILNDTKDKAEVIANNSKNFITNVCYPMKDFLIQNNSHSFNETELLDTLISNEIYLNSLLKTLNISGVKILEKSISTTSMPTQQCFLTNFSNLYSYVVFIQLIENVHR